MSIMDIFKTSTPATPPAGDKTTPTAGKDNLSANPPALGPDGKIPGTAPLDQNPLDVYAKMFDNANKGSELVAPPFALDPKVVGEVSSKMDFTKGIQQEVLQKATSGDVSALMDIIKTVGQNAYRASIEHNTALTNTHLQQRGEFEDKRLERGVSKRLTENELSSVPNYSHPVVKAELNRIAGQFAAANPDVSPSEVAKAAQKYLVDLYNNLNPADPTKNSDGSNKPQEMDWSKYLAN